MGRKSNLQSDFFFIAITIYVIEVTNGKLNHQMYCKTFFGAISCKCQFLVLRSTQKKLASDCVTISTQCVEITSEGTYSKEAG